MTQSKDENTVTLTLGDFMEDEDNTVTINLDETYGTSTTYWAGDSVTDVTFDSNASDDTFTIDNNNNTINIGDWNLSGDFGAISINPSEVERMCKEYPALEKVWRNFKAVYDMIKQDYEGKKKAGEIDDDIPF